MKKRRPAGCEPAGRRFLGEFLLNLSLCDILETVLLHGRRLALLTEGL